MKKIPIIFQLSKTIGNISLSIAAVHYQLGNAVCTRTYLFILLHSMIFIKKSTIQIVNHKRNVSERAGLTHNSPLPFTSDETKQIWKWKYVRTFFPHK